MDMEGGWHRMEMETGGRATGAGGQKAAVIDCQGGLGSPRGRRGSPSPTGTFQRRFSPAPLSKEGLEPAPGPKRMRNRTFSLQGVLKAAGGRAGPAQVAVP